MADYVQFVVVIALLIGIGWLLIIRSKSSPNGSSLRWVGYALILMTIFLIVVGMLQYFAEASHGRGH